MSDWETPQEWAAQNRIRQADRLRKLMALYNDASSPEGEKQAVLAAIERIKLVLTASQFEQAKRDAGSPEASSFAERMRARRARPSEAQQREREAAERVAREAYERLQEQLRAQRQAAQEAAEQRKRGVWRNRSFTYPEPTWADTKSANTNEAYPDAYGGHK